VFDVGGGRGLNQGYGTTDLRLYSAVSFEFRPPEKIEIEVVDPPPPLPPSRWPVPAPSVEMFIGPPPGTGVFLTENEIEVDDRLEFVVDTPILREESRPVVLAVAQVLWDHPEISQLVIEGHASQEGDHDHNYVLSTHRAMAIWEALIKVGVDPDRLSFRGFGETRPRVEGEAESALQENRRVVFVVASRSEPPACSEEGEVVALPWNGAELVLDPGQGCVEPVVEGSPTPW
jgi:outer membrane protein OmpA-like peptidoglycan-associated protein